MTHPVETATNAVAVASLSVPLWLPDLKDVSEFAGEWVPVLGAIWLILQMIRFTIQSVVHLRAWWVRGKGG